MRTAGSDIPASIVVFLVALPLCLGVAQASGAPLFAGVIAGVVGGIVIGSLSGSNLSISGPAAGLTAIVATALADKSNIATFQVFLLCVFIAGLLQVILGFIKAGIIGDFIPNCVIKGMLAGIGLLLILKEIPHFLGDDNDYMGDESFAEVKGRNTFSNIFYAFQDINATAVMIGLLSFSFLIIWELKPLKKLKFFKLVPAPLLIVAAGITINQLFMNSGSSMALGNGHLVALPVATDVKEFTNLFMFPDFSAITNVKVWTVAATLAIVASLETLLSIEAVDKLDPLKRVTPTNRELKAQGIGNMLSGLLGGLPTTSVIVRSSANVSAGSKTKLSAILHGVFLLLSALFLAPFINKIPVAALAAILIFTGYKLAKPMLFIAFYKKGLDQFLPFVVTIAAILLKDLLWGIAIGILVSLYFLLRSGFRSSVFIVNDENKYMIRLRKDVSFLNKSLIKTKLEEVPANAYILIDAVRADFIDKDVIEEINNFMVHAHLKNITVEIKKSLNKPAHQLFTETMMPVLAEKVKVLA